MLEPYAGGGSLLADRDRGRVRRLLDALADA
jgi:hypothetical protein